MVLGSRSGSTTLSASALLLPRGALAEPPPLLDRICAAHGHAAGDVALTAASLVEPFLVAEQRGNPGEVSRCTQDSVITLSGAKLLLACLDGCRNFDRG